MRIKIFCFIAFLSELCFSQKTEPIEGDRPDQTETPSVVPKGMFQVETGFTYQKNDNKNQILSLPSTLWKYGVNEYFELRLVTEFIIEKTNAEKLKGFTPVLIGFKVRVCEEKAFVPKTSFIGHISLPKVASSNYKTDFLAPEFRFTMQHTLSRDLSLGYNLGCEWDGMTPAPTYLYTLTVGHSITDHWGSYIELFGFAPNDESSNHNLDGGITYLITDNFMVDLSSCLGLTSNAPNYYFALGFSFRQ